MNSIKTLLGIVRTRAVDAYYAASNPGPDSWVKTRYDTAPRDATLRAAAAARLGALLPDLLYSKQTHVLWRDCDQKKRDLNPQIGDVEFHAQCVRDYAERIAAIEEAVAVLTGDE